MKKAVKIRSTAAADVLRTAATEIEERAALRDMPNGERSMKRTVAAFNAMFDASMTEVQGWQFMQLLKIARASAGAYNHDDYVDGAGYAALAGEAANRTKNDA